MRGRTNITQRSGTVPVNGDIKEFKVAEGNEINVGDFVQIEKGVVFEQLYSFGNDILNPQKYKLNNGFSIIYFFVNSNSYLQLFNKNNEVILTRYFENSYIQAKSVKNICLYDDKFLLILLNGILNVYKFNEEYDDLIFIQSLSEYPRCNSVDSFENNVLLVDDNNVYYFNINNNGEIVYISKTSVIIDKTNYYPTCLFCNKSGVFFIIYGKWDNSSNYKAQVLKGSYLNEELIMDSEYLTLPLGSHPTYFFWDMIYDDVLLLCYRGFRTGNYVVLLNFETIEVINSLPNLKLNFENLSTYPRYVEYYPNISICVINESELFILQGLQYRVNSSNSYPCIVGAFFSYNGGLLTQTSELIILYNGYTDSNNFVNKPTNNVMSDSELYFPNIINNNKIKVFFEEYQWKWKSINFKLSNGDAILPNVNVVSKYTNGGVIGFAKTSGNEGDVIQVYTPYES